MNINDEILIKALHQIQICSAVSLKQGSLSKLNSLKEIIKIAEKTIKQSKNET